MNTEQAIRILKSPAVTIVIGTLCLTFLMTQIPPFIISLKEAKAANKEDKKQ